VDTVQPPRQRARPGDSDAFRTSDRIALLRRVRSRKCININKPEPPEAQPEAMVRVGSDYSPQRFNGPMG